GGAGLPVAAAGRGARRRRRPRPHRCRPGHPGQQLTARRSAQHRDRLSGRTGGNMRETGGNMREVPKRVRVQLGLAALSAALAALTAVWPDWIEILFHADPDAGSGSLEWAICLSLAAAALTLATTSWVQLRR